MPAKTPDQSVTLFIRTLIKNELASGKSMSDLHRELSRFGDVSRPHLINVKDGHRGAGAALEVIFANRLYRGSIDELRRAAVKFAAAADRPERAEAVRIAVGHLGWDQGEAERVAGLVAGRMSAGAGPCEWLDTMKREEDERQRRAEEHLRDSRSKYPVAHSVDAAPKSGHAMQRRSTKPSVTRKTGGNKQ